MNENILKEEIAMLENQIRILQQKNQELKIQISAREEVSNKYKEVIDKAREYINKMFETGFYNDDYYLGHLKQILQDKEAE